MNPFKKLVNAKRKAKGALQNYGYNIGKKILWCNITMEEASVKQSNNRPWLWKKGQSGNPKGRPIGKTAKERAKGYLMAMTDEEFEEFLHGIDKKTIWEMAEGKAKQDLEVSGEMTSKVVRLDIP